MVRRTLYSWALVLLACSACQRGDDPSDEDTDPLPSAFDTGTDTASDTGPTSNARYWELSASVPFEGGAPLLEGSSFQVEVQGAEDPGEEGVLCTASGSPASVSEAEVVPDSLLHHWWTWTWDTLEEDTCAEQGIELTTTVDLGIGTLHAEIRSLLDRSGYSGLESSLYGAYASLGTIDTIWVYGVAGTEANFAGQETTTSEAPIPDGTYHLVPLYAFPLD